VHRIANVPDKLPKRLHTKAKAALHEIVRAESRKAAQEAIARFEADYGAKYPKAVTSLRRDEAELLAFFDFPAEHWVHLRLLLMPQERWRRINGACLIPLVPAGLDTPKPAGDKRGDRSKETFFAAGHFPRGEAAGARAPPEPSPSFAKPAGHESIRTVLS
jgi:hypothetical protein